MIVSQATYAKMHNVTPQAVSAAARRGVLPLTPDGQVDTDHADRTWGRRREQTHRLRTLAADDEARRSEAVLQTLISRIQMTRMKGEKLRGSLVDAEAVRRENAIVLKRLHDEVLRLADYAAPEDLALMRDLIGAVLEDLGDLRGEAERLLRED
jgi:hypothetical protein